MPPLAILSMISYWPKRSGPVAGTAAAGSARRRVPDSSARDGAVGEAGALGGDGGVAPAGGRGLGDVIPERVSERIRSTSVPEESLGLGAGAGGVGTGIEICGAAGGFGATPGRDPRFRPESVSRRRLSISLSPATGFADVVGAVGAADGGGRSRGRRAAWRAGRGAAGCGDPASSLRSESTSEKMSFDVRGDAAAASCVVSIRMVLAPMSDESSASLTEPTRSSSLKGRARMSKAPTFCASALRFVPR